MFTEFDTRMMARALQQARLGRFWAAPNPHVGCVLARDGKRVAEGFTQPAGQAHAEVNALAGADDVRGATAYVTLEPCSHEGKTGPCAKALVEAGVARVVIAAIDPNPLVSRRGVAILEAAGVTVEVGLLEAQARAIIPGFFMRMEQGRPRVRVKMAMSLDGRTAMASGESQWITGPAARQDVQRMRAESCAILTGVGTVLADDCSLTVRADELGLAQDEAARALTRQPLRVVLDSQARVPAGSAVLDDRAPTLVCVAGGVDTTDLARTHAEVVSLEADAGGIDLQALMGELARRQCNEILVESGARVAGALLEAGLVDELVVYMAPALMGSSARPLFTLPFDTMAEKVELTIDDVRKVGGDWRFTARRAGD